MEPFDFSDFESVFENSEKIVAITSLIAKVQASYFEALIRENYGADRAERLVTLVSQKIVEILPEVLENALDRLMPGGDDS